MPGRLRHVDDLRVALTVGVILAHAAITYGAEGSWFYTERAPDPVRIALTVPLAAVAIFGIGLFFFLAGAFTPASIARKGRVRFAADRCLRLGLPLLVYVVLVIPLVRWCVDGGDAPSAWRGQLHDPETGPLWFVAVLLLCTLVAAPLVHPAAPGPLRPRTLVLAAAGIALVTFALRLRWRVDSSQVLDLHVWQWGQCLGLFALGVQAGRRGWFTQIAPELRRTCLRIGLLGELALLVTVAAFAGNTDPLGGGPHPQAAIVAVLEGVICVCAAIALTDALRGRDPARGRLTRVLARSAYGAFVLQTPVLVGLALALRDTSLPVLVRFLVVAPLAVAASFGLTALLLRAGPVRRVL